MSYVDGNSSKGRRMLTSGSVALLQAGLALAVIKGFTVAFVEPDKPAHLPTQTYPTAPMPSEPLEPPTADQKKPIRETFVDRTVARVPVRDAGPAEAIPLTPVGPTGTDELTDFTFIPPVEPSEPPARFTPRSAKPRGDTAQWVTTADYPTADIRAEHAGTVRFRLSLDAGGRVTDCAIVQSSGYPGLDEATCRNVTRRARFDPATDEAGERVAGSFSGTIRWVIPRD